MNSDPYVYRPGRSGKGTKIRGPLPKSQRQKFLTVEEFTRLLAAVKADTRSKHRKRDHCLLFCGFYFGLRVSECAKLTRHAFRFIDSNEARIPTLKQGEKLKVFCATCDKIKYFSTNRSGKTIRCGCGALLKLPRKSKSRNPGGSEAPVEYSPPAVEEGVYEFLRQYIAALPEHQEFLFESAHGPMHSSSLNRVFNKYACKAGLDRRYCWHALRHGRGVQVYERSKGKQKAVQDMLRHKSLATSAIYIHMSPKAFDELRGDLSKDFTPQDLD